MFFRHNTLLAGSEGPTTSQTTGAAATRRSQRFDRALAAHLAFDIVGVGGLDPGEHLAKFLTRRLDRVLLTTCAQFLELRCAGVLVVDEALRERSVLDVREHGLHVLLHARVDDPGPGDVVAVFRGVGDRPALLGDPALDHEVDDELELVEHLEVGNLGLVAGLGENLEAVLHELGGPTAQDRLFAEEVGLGFFGEGGLDPTGAQPADGLGVGERERPGLTGVVLLDRDDHGYSAAVDVFAAHDVARALGGDHDDVNGVLGLDEAVADVESVPEHECGAVGEVRCDLFGVDDPLHRVGGEENDDVGLLHSVGNGEDLEPLVFRLLDRGAALSQAYANVNTGVAQAQSVGVPLAAVADDGDLLGGNDGQVGIVVIEQLSHRFSP